jgi:NADH dehydrogenase FAD-containing subunit
LQIGHTLILNRYIVLRYYKALLGISERRLVSTEPLMTDVRVILVCASDKILEQVDEQLGKSALQKLKQEGVEFIMNHQVKRATPTSAR